MQLQGARQARELCGAVWRKGRGREGAVGAWCAAHRVWLIACGACRVPRGVWHGVWRFPEESFARIEREYAEQLEAEKAAQEGQAEQHSEL